MVRNLLPAVIAILLCFSLACSGSEFTPSGGDIFSYSPNPVLLAQDNPDVNSSNRFLWGYWNISWDPATGDMEAVPVRGCMIHINALKFLESTMCQTCLIIGANEVNADGNLEVEIGIKHPISIDGAYKKEVFTGFDVRGIAVFEGAHYFNAHGKKAAVNTDVEYTLVNADGYTRLWSPADFPPGSLGREIFEYYPGKFEANGSNLSTTLNPFIAFWTQPQRRYFAADDHAERIYEINLPNGPVPLEFGYAVDGSWAKPANIDNPAVPTDFPPNANSIEAYRIDADFTGAVTPIGGTLTATIHVYDWQGAGTIEPDPNGVQLECIELFNEKISASFVADYGDYAEYTVAIHNDFSADLGTYPLLVSASDIYTVPIIGDVDAYMIFYIDVVPPLQLLETVDMGYYPIEAAFNPTAGACYFGPIPGTQYVRVEGIDQNFGLITGFPEMEWVTGGVALCNITQQMFVATDYLLPSDAWKNDVSVFKTTTKTLDYSISIPPSTNEFGSNPIDFAVFENMSEVWVSLYGDNEVGSFLAGVAAPTITRLDVGTGPTTLAIDEVGYNIYVACDGNDTISIINGFTHEIQSLSLVTPMDSPDPGLPATPGMAYVPGNHTLYIATLMHGTVDCYDMTTKTFVKSIQLATPDTEVVIGLIYDPTTNLLIATGISVVGHVWAIDPETNAEIYEAETTGSTPTFPDVDSNNGLVFVPDPTPGTGHVDIFKIIH